jgi:microcompartment protein CcmK/EutM
MDVELNQRLVPDAREAVNLAGFDDENVTGPSLELLTVDAIEAAAVLDELNFIIRVPMRTGTAARKAVKEKGGDVDVAVVGSHDIVRASFEGQLVLADTMHRVGDGRDVRACYFAAAGNAGSFPTSRASC